MNDFVTQRMTFGRCPICDWPMAESADKGCVPGDCSYRPEDPAEQRRIRERREELAKKTPPPGGMSMEEAAADSFGITEDDL